MRLIWVRTKAECFSFPGLTPFLKIRSDLPVVPFGRARLPPHRHCERSEAIHSAACGDVDCFASLAMTKQNYHASMHGRFLVVRASGFGTERSPAMIHCRVSAGSITSSISSTEAIETALPLA